MIDPVPVDTIIKGILEAPFESRSVELKPSIPWNDLNQQQQLQEIVKSILGMSNIKDGGKIILGVKQNPDKSFEIEGMEENHLKTYDQEKIYQDVRNIGEPEPRFEIKNMEYGGKCFIVFLIQEFLYSPIICRKDGKNLGKEPLVKGALYIRTHKPETKKVDNETEMREIINLAVDKELDQFLKRKQRLEISKSWEDDKEQFYAEIKDIL
ncbi:MAG TPA: AlbA family DNA-binding domain-containing protein [Candidatus Hypogeohydataceae bacterium YC41]